MTEKWRELAGRLSAEFLIIVLGVTIALWADGWVAQRADQAEEVARLHALRDNVTQTLAELAKAREEAQGGAEALRRLVTISPGETDPEHIDQMLRYGLLYGSDFYPELNVYDDLKSSGELALLTNSDLRQSLAIMDSRLGLVRLAQEDLATVQQLNVDAYMIERMDLRSFYGSLTLTGDDDSPRTVLPDLSFTSEMAFHNVVLLKLDVVMQLQVVLERAETVLTIVLDTINAQLSDGDE